MFWLGLGIGSVAYGLRGERIPGKIITITEEVSDNGLRMAERAFWVASGVAEIAFGLLDMRARFLAE